MEPFHPVITKTFRILRTKKVITMLLCLITLVLKFALLLQLQRTIDTVSSQDVSAAFSCLKLDAFLLAGFFFSNCVMQYFFRDLQYNSHYVLIKELFRLSLGKGCEYHTNTPPSITLSMIKDDSKFISDWESIGSITLFFNLFTLVTAFLLLFSYNVWIALFLLLSVTFCFAATSNISRKIGADTCSLQKSFSELNRELLDSLTGIREIWQYQKQTHFYEKITEFIEHDTAVYSRQLSHRYSVITSIYALLTTALPILTILIGLLLIIKKQYTIGKLVVTYALVANLQEPVLEIPNFLNQYRQALSMQKRLLPILTSDFADFENVYPSASRRSISSPALSYPQNQPFKTLFFQSERYAYTASPILKNISFQLEKGHHLLIEGESGKGKTTLLEILSRFCTFKNQPVIVSFDGISITRISPDVYYKKLLMLQQTPHIFHDTLLNNLLLGDSYSEEALHEAVVAACIENLLETKGASYLLETNGNNLSGGQRQRVGLARVLLRKPDFLLLDEPISALNPELADLVTKRVVEYCSRYQISLIVVSHNDAFRRILPEERTQILHLT